MAIEVFELAENEDALSPVDMEPEKLVHKFKEVGGGLGWGRWRQWLPAGAERRSPPTAPDQTRCDRSRDPATEKEGVCALRLRAGGGARTH